MTALIQEVKEKMRASIDHLRAELRGIRSGKANPAVLDGVSVEAYGSQMRLKDLANTTNPEPRQLLVTPFDASNASPIAKGIEKANLGLQATVDGNVVRITIPEMSQEVREEMKKLCGKKAEEAKVGVRNVRRHGMSQVKQMKDDGEIAEDELKRLEKEVQNLTDSFCKEVDTLAQEKEKEIITI